MSARVTFSIEVRVTFKEERGWVIAGAPDLDVYTQGASLPEARDNLVEAIQAFLISCYERGVLDAALKQCGFEPDLSESGGDGDEHLTVPFSLLSARHVAQANAN